MSPRPLPASSDTALDDFDWPPTADNVSVHEIEADPWQPAENGDDQPSVTVTVTIEDELDVAVGGKR